MDAKLFKCVCIYIYILSTMVDSVEEKGKVATTPFSILDWKKEKRSL